MNSVGVVIVVYQLINNSASAIRGVIIEEHNIKIKVE